MIDTAALRTEQKAELAALVATVTQLEASLADLPRAANAPAELAAELEECRARELPLYKKVRDGDAAAASELVVLNAKLKILPDEVEQAKTYVSKALGPMLDLAMQVQEQLKLAAEGVTSGMTDRIAEVIERAVAPILPPGAKANYLSAASGLVSHLPGHSVASGVSQKLSFILANAPHVRAEVEHWPFGLDRYTHHNAFRVAVETLAVAKEFLASQPGTSSK